MGAGEGRFGLCVRAPADAPAILSNSVSAHPPLMCHRGPTRRELHLKAADCVRPSDAAAAAAGGLSVSAKHTEQ